jgi:hypothetical protein
MRFSNEAEKWIEHYKNNKRPYGCCRDRGDFLLLSAIKGRNGIQATIVDQGIVILKMINKTIRIRPVSKTIVVWYEEEKVCWLNAVNAEGNKLTFRKKIEPNEADDIFYKEYNWSQEFKIIRLGIENIKSQFLNKPRVSTSTFLCEGSGGYMDWLGALAEMGKGFPGGQLIFGPIIHLRKQLKNQNEFNALNIKLDRLIQNENKINRDFINEIMPTETDEVLKRMILESLNTLIESLLINEQRNSSMALSELKNSLRTSSFPFPFGKAILLDELNLLFEHDIQPLDDCLKRSLYTRIPDRFNSNVDYIFKFVNSIPGQELLKLQNIFTCLVEKCGGSQIINAVLQYIKEIRP